MLEIRNFTEEHLNKYYDAFVFVNNELPVKDGKYYIVGNGSEEKLLYRYDDVFCVFYIDKEKDTCVDMFTIDDNYKVKEIATDDYDVDVSGDYPMFFERSTGYYHSLTIIRRPNEEVDVDGYNGLIVYTQFNSDNNSKSSIIYQCACNGNNRIYDFKQRRPFQICIEKNVNKLIHSKKHYVVRKYDSESIMTDFMIIKDYGLQEFLENGNYHLMVNEGEERYYRMIGKTPNDYAITLFPFCKQYQLSDMNELLIGLGHQTSIPKFIKDFYNGDYSLLSEYSEICDLMKKNESEEIEPVLLKFERGGFDD